MSKKRRKHPSNQQKTIQEFGDEKKQPRNPPGKNKKAAEQSGWESFPWGWCIKWLIIIIVVVGVVSAIYEYFNFQLSLL